MHELACVERVVRRYGPVTALQDVSMAAYAGEVLGVLGPNGAGKSTLVSLIVGLRSPDSGSVRVLGGDPRDHRTRVRLGVARQDGGFPETLRVREVVRFVAGHYPQPRSIDETLAAFGLSDLAKRPAGKLSGGQRRRLSVALAFVGRPRLVVLDEPSAGLDVESRHALWQGIEAFAREGGGAVLCSHQMDEVERLATRVLVLHRGRVVADDSIDAVTSQLGGHVVSYRGPAPPDGAPVIETVRAGDECRVSTHDPDGLVRVLSAHGWELAGLRVERVALEEALLSLSRQERRA